MSEPLNTAGENNVRPDAYSASEQSPYAQAQPSQPYGQSQTGQPYGQPQPGYNPYASNQGAPGMPCQPYPYTAPQGQIGQKSKIAAGLLGIFLGCLGIHKFYLGCNTSGIIMLLISLLTLFTLSFIPAIIGFIEGIIYLTMDDYRFYQTYEVGKKEWF